MLAVLRRPRVVLVAGLAALCVLAWIYVLRGAGSGMSAWQMTATALFPHRSAGSSMPGMEMPSLHWDPSGVVLAIAMWWTMMIAMMTPSAAPAILLYANVRRHALQRSGVGRPLASSGVFASGYLLVWLLFSVVAVALQWVFVSAGWLSSEFMWSQSRWLSAVLLVAAGAYQLSPLKETCLSGCRSPAAFFARHARAGALRMGVLHGAYCVGCCGVLMTLLFVGGVMNVLWIAVLTLFVAVEKLLPRGRMTSRAAGALLMIWGLATAFA